MRLWCVLGRLLGLDVAYFFRAVLEKFDELGEEPNCLVADVQASTRTTTITHDPDHHP